MKTSLEFKLQIEPDAPKPIDAAVIDGQLTVIITPQRALAIAERYPGEPLDESIGKIISSAIRSGTGLDYDKAYLDPWRKEDS